LNLASVILALSTIAALPAGAQQNTTAPPGMPPSQNTGHLQNGGGQGDPGGNGRPHGPPPNIMQAIQLLDQAKQSASGETLSEIEQAEELLKQPPPRRGGQGCSGPREHQGNNSGPMMGPPPGKDNGDHQGGPPEQP
jgi:hypothetical protein